MPLRPIQSSLTISWLSHDSWSESYIGTRRLAYELLPPPGTRQTAEDGALCQLALIGANHLMEVALYKILLPYTEAVCASPKLPRVQLEKSSYFDMLNRWLPVVLGTPLDLASEPFASTERLRERRHATVHKTSALATVQMARSSLYTAVEGTKTLFALAKLEFPYAKHLAKYPQSIEQPFTQVLFPAGT